MYPTTALDPATVPLSRLRAQLFTGPGAAGFDAVASALRAAADSVGSTADDLDALLGRDGAVHAGPAADAARAHLTAVHADAVADAGRLTRAARAAGELAQRHAAARRDVGAAPEEPTGASAAALLGAAIGGGDERRARRAVAAYQDGCNDVLTGALPVFPRSAPGPA